MTEPELIRQGWANWDTVWLVLKPPYYADYLAASTVAVMSDGTTLIDGKPAVLRGGADFI